MKSIKNNDARNFEAELLAITKHLGYFLKDIRKRKAVNELIGNDECSKNFVAFADELSAGAEFTQRDNQRINERAVKLTNQRPQSKSSNASVLNCFQVTDLEKSSQTIQT